MMSPRRLATAVLCALPTVWLLSAFHATAADWPMWRYNAGRGNATPQALPASLSLQWVRELPPADPAWPASQGKLQFDAAPEPVVIGQRIFVPSSMNDNITAYDTRSGAELWRFYAEGPVRFAPLAHNGHVYFVADDGFLYCLDAAEGKLVWKVSGGPARRWVLGNDRLVSSWPARGAPVLHQGKIFFAASVWPFMGIFVHAVDPETGRIVWTNSGDGTNYVPQPHGGAVGFATIVPQGHLVAEGDHLIVPGGRSTPAIFDTHTGKLLHFAFDKRVGGYFVSAARGAYFLEGKIYHTADGKPLGYGEPAAIDDDKVITTRGSLVQVNELEGVVTSSSIDRRGETTVTASLSATRLYYLKLEGGPVKIFCKAGPRIYTADKREIAAFDIARGEGEADGATRRVVWSAKLEGDISSMLAADDRLFVTTADSRLYCFGGEAPVQVAHHRLGGEVLAEHRDEFTERVASLLQLPAARGGYAVVMSIGSGRLINELLRQSKLSLIAVDPDPRKVESLRRRMQAVRFYGERISANVGEAQKFEFPPYLANLVVAEDCGAAGLDELGTPNGPKVVRHLFDVLRPYGGTACFELSAERHEQFVRDAQAAGLAGAKLQRHGRWTLLSREGALPGSDDWTHQYGTAAQGGISGETLVKAPLGVLWFGGPANDGVLPRHGHGPSPQVAGGRLIIEGPDLLRAVDVYTGRLLWEKPLQGLGAYYDTTRHFPGAAEIGGNYVTTADRVYVVHSRAIAELDAVTGNTLRQFSLPAGADGQPPYFGYLSVWDDLLVATAEPLDAPLPGTPIPEERTAASKTAEKAPAEKSKEAEKSRASEKTKAVPPPKPSPDEIPVPNVKPFEDLPPKKKSSGRDDDDDAPDSKPKTDILGGSRGPLEAPVVEPLQTRYASGSRRLVVFDRSTGKMLWTRPATQTFRHNTIVVAAGKLFCIDALTESRRLALVRRGVKLQGSAILYALDARTGRPLWSTPDDVSATFVNYSVEHDLLLLAGSRSRDRSRDELSRGMVALRGQDGEVLWKNDLSYDGPCLFWRDQIITNGSSGFAVSIKTGKPTGWRFMRAYGCNTAIGCQNLLTFRSGAAGFYDLLTDSGTGNIGGFRSGCTNNLIPADGVLSAPDYTRTCTCAYQNQTSLALIHMPEADYWTYGAAFREGQMGVNFGAPGDRRAPSGTLWVDFPSVGGPSKDVPLTMEPKDPQIFRLHSSAIAASELPWVAASGVLGARRLTIKVTDGHPRRLNFHFCEPNLDCAAGERRFDVFVQGEKVLADFDVSKEAGGPRRGIVKSFVAKARAGEIVIELSAQGERPTIISGLEILRQ